MDTRTITLAADEARDVARELASACILGDRPTMLAADRRLHDLLTWIGRPWLNDPPVPYRPLRGR